MAKSKDHDAVFVDLVAKCDSAYTFRATSSLSLPPGAFKQKEAKAHFEQLLAEAPSVAWGVPVEVHTNFLTSYVRAAAKEAFGKLKAPAPKKAFIRPPS
eukprot:5454220-Prorocentrum_lima.AAC.1